MRIISDKSATLIAGYVPNLRQNIVAPLRAAGYEEEQIQNLGNIDLG